ncbi:MAG: c-type cytochrome, partial [Fimbriimonas sp.]|nr:c-type cytochrome [Fimbriimonas sp.]
SDLDKEFADAGKGKHSAPPKPTSSTKPATSPKASNKELDDLDKEFADSGKGKKASKPATASQPSKPASGSKGSDKELADLDKEFADDSKGKQTPAASSTTSSKSGGSDKEMADLDKEFADSKSAPKGPTPGTSTAPASATPATQSAPAAPSFEEADFKVDLEGAKARFEAAQRDLLNSQKIHNKEMIGLPETETGKRQLSDGRWSEAQQKFEVARAEVPLEQAKSDVKKAAQWAKWAAEAKELDDLTAKSQLSAQPADRQKELQDAKTGLAAHIADLTRDLRLIEGELTRNGSQSPDIDQNYVDRLGSIDRCSTCHRAVEQTGFEAAAEPFRTHTPDLLKYHPIERFGCVSCHGGWGNALNKNEAHGQIIGKGRPLLVGDQVQSSCGKCHGETRQLSGEETYLAGAQLFKASGCLGCHKVEPNRLLASVSQNNMIVQSAMPKAGPVLDRVSEKIQPAWLVGWLRNPQSHSLDARMPNLGLKIDEATGIATYLLTQHGIPSGAAKSEPSSLDQARLAQGKRLVQNLGCLGCHAIRGEGLSVGPDLTNIRTKVNAQWLYNWIANPKLYYPASRMPVLNLTSDQCVLIGDYLLSVGDGKPNPQDSMPDLTNVQAKNVGARLIAERGCAGCHDIKGFDRISAPELTHVGDKTADVLEFGNARNVKRNLYDYILTKITDPRAFDTGQFTGKMPKFGLDKEDARTIAIYLMSLTSDEVPPEYAKDLLEQGSPLLAGRKIVDQQNCLACHRIAGQGGKIGPELTREGEMVRPSWLFEFLKRPARIRWWADARMPNFQLNDQDAAMLTEYFMALSNQPAPYEYTPPDQKVFPMAVLGAKYFMDLKCQSCHPIGGKQGVAGGDTKKLGPDLGMSPIRLKKDWMLRFLKDPQSFSPGTQMPNFNKPDSQYSAIIDYLMKQRTTP